MPDDSAGGGGDLRIVIGHAPDGLPGLRHANHVAVAVRDVVGAILGLAARVRR